MSPLSIGVLAVALPGLITHYARLAAWARYGRQMDEREQWRRAGNIERRQAPQPPEDITLYEAVRARFGGDDE